MEQIEKLLGEVENQMEQTYHTKRIREIAAKMATICIENFKDDILRKGLNMVYAICLYTDAIEEAFKGGDRHEEKA